MRKPLILIFKNFNLFADLQYRNIYYKLDGTLEDLRTLDQVHDIQLFQSEGRDILYHQ